MSEKRLKINNLDNFTFPNHFLIVGPTKSGKSHLLKWMFYKKFYKEFDAIYLISGTISEDYTYIPAAFQSDNEPEFKLIINGVLEQQKQYKLNGSEMPRIAIILDDIVGVVDRYKHDQIELFDKLYTRGRHYNISVFGIIQNITLLSTTIRYNTKYIIYTCVIGSQYDLLYEVVGKGFDNKKEFKTLINNICKDYRCVCFDAHTSERRIYLLKADEKIPNFIMVP